MSDLLVVSWPFPKADFLLKTFAAVLLLFATWLSVCPHVSSADSPYAFLESSPTTDTLAPNQFPQPMYFAGGYSADNWDPPREHEFPSDDWRPSLEPEIQPIQYPFESSGGVDFEPEPPPLVTAPQRPRPPAGWGKRSMQFTALPGSGDSLGIFEIESRATNRLHVFPLLSVTPQFSFRTLDGPITTDLPGTLFDFSLGVSLFVPLSEQWSLLAGVSPGAYSDFDSYSADSIRIPGRLFAIYKWSETLSLVGGIMYLDREDIGFLPAAGLTYTPNDDLRLELSFPKPKISWRYYNDQQRSRHVYLAGELGGGTWTVRRAVGVDDSVTLRDFRLLAGWEHRENEQVHWSLEAGYVFGREVEYLSEVGNLDLDSTALVRFSFGY